MARLHALVIAAKDIFNRDDNGPGRILCGADYSFCEAVRIKTFVGAGRVRGGGAGTIFF